MHASSRRSWLARIMPSTSGWPGIVRVRAVDDNVEGSMALLACCSDFVFTFPAVLHLSRDNAGKLPATSSLWQARMLAWDCFNERSNLKCRQPLTAWIMST